MGDGEVLFSKVRGILGIMWKILRFSKTSTRFYALSAGLVPEFSVTIGSVERI